MLQIRFRSGQLQLRLVDIESNQTEYLIDLKTYFEHCSGDQFAHNLYGKCMENCYSFVDCDPRWEDWDHPMEPKLNNDRIFV